MSATAPATPSLEPLLRPRSVAVVGASADLAKPGGRALDFLRRFGFDGPVYGVNPREGAIGDVPCVAGVDDLPEGVDLIVVVIGAAHVPGVLEAAGRRGIRSAVVLSSGFRETGAEGAELEERIAAIAAANGIALLGPNCLGFADIGGRVCATFTTALQTGEPLPGPVAFVSQSGAMGAAIFGLAQSEGLGLGMFVSTGNEAQIGVAEVLAHLARAPGDRSVLLSYVEGLTDGRALVAAIRDARGAGKDVAMLKVGTTDAGREAARSHTGAMAGSNAAWEAALRRAGALRAGSPRELLDVAAALQVPHRPAGRRVGIVSMSGGAGVMMADRAAEHGLELAPLADATRERLMEVLPGFSALANPVDFGGAYGDPAAIAATARAVAEDPGIDLVVMFMGLTPLLAGHIEEPLAAIPRDTGKPLILAWLAGPAAGRARLRELGVPAYEDPVRAVDVAVSLVASAQELPADHASEPDPALVAELSGRGADLSEHETTLLLARYGLAIVREQPAATADEAARIGAELGGPLVVKAQAPGLVHKSDAGAVVLGVAAADVGAAFAQVTAAARAAGAEPVGALVADLAPPGGIELLVGTRWDPQFGPLVVVGAGGVTSELEQDVCVDLAPVGAERASEMLAALRLAPRLAGFRGAPAADVSAAAEAIAAVSRLAADAGPALRELDINPIAVYPEGQGCLVLDAAAILEDA